MLLNGLTKTVWTTEMLVHGMIAAVCTVVGMTLDFVADCLGNVAVHNIDCLDCLCDAIDTLDAIAEKKAHN